MDIAALTVGDWVVVRGYGPRRVVSVEGGRCSVADDEADGSLTFRAEQVASRFRPLMDGAAAAAVDACLLATEGPPEARTGIELTTERDRVLRAGTPLDQARLLQGIYRVAAPLDPTQEAAIDALEAAILPELAHVTGGTVSRLRAKHRRGKPAFGYVAPVRDDGPLPPPPAVPGWTALGGFRVYADLAVGELPASSRDRKVHRDGSRDTVVLGVLPGVWYGLAAPTEDGTRIVAAHASVLRAAPALLRGAEPAGVVNVEGGTLHFVDAEVRDDASYRRALEEGDGRGRALVMSTGGDGGYAISVTRAGGRVVLVTTEVDA